MEGGTLDRGQAKTSAPASQTSSFLPPHSGHAPEVPKPTLYTIPSGPQHPWDPTPGSKGYRCPWGKTRPAPDLGQGVPRGPWEGTPNKQEGRWLHESWYQQNRTMVPWWYHGHHLQKTKELLKAACREGLLAQGVSGCASVVGMCKGTPGHSPAQTPLVTQEPSQLRLPRLWPQDGSTESLLGTGLNNKVAGNKNAGWHFRLPLAPDDSPSARGKNQTQPEDAEDGQHSLPTTTTFGRR